MSDRASTPSRTYRSARESILPRAASTTGSERLLLPTAPVASSMLPPNSTEWRARSEFLIGRHGQTFDGRHGPVPPAEDTISVMVDGSLVHYRRARVASHPITEAGRLAAGASVDWDSWREEIRTQRAHRIGNLETAAVADETVLPSIEPESDPFTALQSAVNDSQRVITRELQIRVDLEHENRRLRKERNHARKVCLEFYNELEETERMHLRTIRDYNDELEAADEMRDTLATLLDRERIHFDSARNRQRNQIRRLTANLQTVRAHLAAAQQPPVAARPISPIIRAGRGRGARAGSARQKGRGGRGSAAVVVREQPARACKVEKRYRS